MSTATGSPRPTSGGDDALNALRRTGWGRLTKDSFQRFRTADGFTNDLHHPDRGGPARRRPAQMLIYIREMPQRLSRHRRHT